MTVCVSDNQIENEPAEQRARIEGGFDRCVLDQTEALVETGTAFLFVFPSWWNTKSLAEVLLM